MNRDRLLGEAKTFALELTDNYKPPAKPTFVALGERGRDPMHALLDKLNTRGITTPHDLVVGRVLAHLLCGGDRVEGENLSESQLCQLEREAFITLADTEATVDRIEYMLTQGSPLKN